MTQGNYNTRNEGMNDSPIAMERDSNSPFEGGLFRLTEEAVRLAKHISQLEERLSPLSNNRPRPESPNEGMKDSPDVTGDSPLLSQVNILHKDLKHMVDRVVRLLGALDI